MPEDVKTDEELETQETPQLVHDDIVQRLLDYQRQLREGAPDEPTPASNIEISSPQADEVIDLTAVEEPAAEALIEGSDDGSAIELSPGSADIPADVAEVIDIATGRAPDVGAFGDEATEQAAVISGEESAAADTVEAASEATRELADRIAGMERSLERLSSKFAELRSSFQDMAIAADERLADIEDVITELRTP